MITSAEGRFTESRRGGLGRNELFSLQPLLAGRSSTLNGATDLPKALGSTAFRTRRDQRKLVFTSNVQSSSLAQREHKQPHTICWVIVSVSTYPLLESFKYHDFGPEFRKSKYGEPNPILVCNQSVSSVSDEIQKPEDPRIINRFSDKTILGSNTIAKSVDKRSESIQRSSFGGAKRKENCGQKKQCIGIGLKLQEMLMSSLHAIEILAASLERRLVQLALFDKHAIVCIQKRHGNAVFAASDIDLEEQMMSKSHKDVSFREKSR